MTGASKSSEQADARSRADAMALPRGTVPSPNIWQQPATYELENRAVDPEHLIEAQIATWLGTPTWQVDTVVDIGCGTGFHLPELASHARHVVGVEPHPDLLALARRRTRRLPQVDVRQGTAQDLPVADASVDVAHARWAYFFGPGCEPGLAELDRVMRRGGSAFVIDNDASRSTFGGWFRRGYPSIDPVAVERFWSVRGWSRLSIDTRWQFTHRADLERVVRIEFEPALAEDLLAEHPGTEVDYAVNLWAKRF